MGTAAKMAGWVALAWLALAAPAPALIKVEFPVSRIYGDSETVAVGAVVSMNPENRVAEIQLAALKGGPLPETVRLQIATPPELAGTVAPGGPVVLFVRGTSGEPLGIVHLAGVWLMAPAGGPPADARRLTGAPPVATATGSAAGEFRLAFSADCDGNGKRDFVAVTERGGIALLNRGLGVFLADDTIPRKFRPDAERPLPFAVTTRTRAAAGDARGLKPRQNLLLLAKDGRLFEMVNTAN